MTSTERKLDEAKYFLGQLNPNFPYFDYILSAFLNAARSTAWVMRNEFCKTEGWENWYKECYISESERELLEKTNELRISASKKSGIKTEFNFMDYIIPDEKYYPVIDKMLKDLEGKEIKVTFSTELTDNADDEVEDSYKIRGIVKMNKDESEMSRESISRLCTEYFKFLEKQVILCVNLFSIFLLKKDV
jgi:hypothetical protein